MEIEWKPIEGYEGIYEVSNNGRIRSIDRIEWSRGIQRLRKGIELKPRLLKGYEAVTLRKFDIKPVARLVHRAVALAFCEGFGDQVRHLDGNKRNNNHENLRWGTAKENADDRQIHGRTIMGEKHHKSKYSNAEIVSIRRLREKGLTLQNIAERFDTTKSRISEIVRRKTWNHVI